MIKTYEMELLEEGNMTFTDFVTQAKETNKLNVTRDKHYYKSI